MCIVYKDRTFCANSSCKNYRCDRRATNEIFSQAENFGLPLSVADFGSNCEGYRELNSDIKPFVDNLNRQEQR